MEKPVKEIILNDHVKNTLSILLAEKAKIEKQLDRDINLIVESNNLGRDNAKYELAPDLSKITIKYLQDEK